MFVAAQDLSPPSMLDIRAFSRQMVVGGALITLGAHVLFPTAVFALLSAFTAVGIGADHPSETRPILDDHIVEARFVRLGKKRDPGRLPDRVVPIKSTAPDRSTVVSRKLNPDKPKKREDEEKEPPPDAAEDLLTRLGDRAQAFAEIAEQREREGDPEGVQWGTEKEGREGDIYRGKLVAFFHRGWALPTTLNPEAVRDLKVRVEVQLTQDLHVGAFKLVGSSGNPLFDQSVTDRLQQLRHLGTPVPEPPAEAAGRYRGQTIVVRFLGRNVR
jgi:hypothetical protein